MSSYDTPNKDAVDALESRLQAEGHSRLLSHLPSHHELVFRPQAVFDSRQPCAISPVKLFLGRSNGSELFAYANGEFRAEIGTTVTVMLLDDNSGPLALKKPFNWMYGIKSSSGVVNIATFKAFSSPIIHFFFLQWGKHIGYPALVGNGTLEYHSLLSSLEYMDWCRQRVDPAHLDNNDVNPPVAWHAHTEPVVLRDHHLLHPPKDDTASPLPTRSQNHPYPTRTLAPRTRPVQSDHPADAKRTTYLSKPPITKPNAWKQYKQKYRRSQPMPCRPPWGKDLDNDARYPPLQSAILVSPFVRMEELNQRSHGNIRMYKRVIIDEDNIQMIATPEAQVLRKKWHDLTVHHRRLPSTTDYPALVDKAEVSDGVVGNHDNTDHRSAATNEETLDPGRAIDTKKHPSVVEQSPYDVVAEPIHKNSVAVIANPKRLEIVDGDRGKQRQQTQDKKTRVGLLGDNKNRMQSPHPNTDMLTDETTLSPARVSRQECLSEHVFVEPISKSLSSQNKVRVYEAHLDEALVLDGADDGFRIAESRLLETRPPQWTPLTPRRRGSSVSIHSSDGSSFSDEIPCYAPIAESSSLDLNRWRESFHDLSRISQEDAAVSSTTAEAEEDRPEDQRDNVKYGWHDPGRKLLAATQLAGRIANEPSIRQRWSLHLKIEHLHSIYEDCTNQLFMLSDAIGSGQVGIADLQGKLEMMQSLNQESADVGTKIEELEKRYLVDLS